MLPRQLHRKPTEAGAKFRSLLSKAYHRFFFFFFFKPFCKTFILGARYPHVMYEFKQANVGPPDPTWYQRLPNFFSFSEDHCWLTPICWWSASGSSSSASALYSSNASSSTSGSPSNYKEEKILCNSELRTHAASLQIFTQNLGATSWKPQTLE